MGGERSGREKEGGEIFNGKQREDSSFFQAERDSREREDEDRDETKKTMVLTEVKGETRTFKWDEEGEGKNVKMRGMKRGREGMEKSFDQSEGEGKEQSL
jgi:hypothetical protein